MSIETTVVCDGCKARSRGPFTPDGWLNYKITRGPVSAVTDGRVELRTICDSCHKTYTKVLDMLSDPEQAEEVKRVNLAMEVNELRDEIAKRNIRIKEKIEREQRNDREIADLTANNNEWKEYGEELLAVKRSLVARVSSLRRKIRKFETPPVSLYSEFLKHGNRRSSKWMVRK
jgi:chromosome segregation ATPase